MRDDKMLLAFGDIDEKYLAEARPRRKARVNLVRRLTVAASFLLVIGITFGAVMLRQGSSPNNGELSPEFLGAMQDYIINGASSVEVVVGDSGGSDGSVGDVLPNGNYTEVTDNQVDGIVEGDLVKATDKYLFRLGNHTIYIYSINGEKSNLVSTYTLPFLTIERTHYRYYDMFLSDDGRTLTLFCEYGGGTLGTTVIFSIDISNIKKPVEKNTVTIEGRKNIVRKIGDKFYLISDWLFEKNRIDLDNPESYIPSIKFGDKTHICDFDKIVYPESISQVSYRYVTVFNEKDMSLYNEMALMKSGSIYFTESNILFAYQYYSKESVGEKNVNRCYSKIGVLNISDGLTWRGDFTVKGWAKDQYSFDERDGMLRMVVSVSDRGGYNRVAYDNASLYIYDLKTLERVAAVEDFAPYGEYATSVRFEGEKLYVCTAEVIKYTDPVYFFNLSDYSNITYISTGFIDGFSTSLVDLGDGYLLGVGKENSDTNKIEIYKRDGDMVTSVDKYLFTGSMNINYKSFLIDREKNLFGVSVSGYVGDDSQKKDTYLIFCFDGGQLQLVSSFGKSSDYARAFARGEYVYLTLPDDLYVIGVDGNDVCTLTNTHKQGEWTTITSPACGEYAELQRVCSCGRVSTKKDYTYDYIAHELKNGICSLCGKDVGSAKHNAELLIYTSLGDGTCYVSGTRERLGGVVEIPSKSPEGDKVIGIGKTAFMVCAITEITLPKSVTVIDDYAFYWSSLTSIDTKNTCIIGVGAFMQCEELTNVILSDKLTKIGGSAFQYCKALETIDIPDSVTEIGERAFESCDKLKEIRLPAGLKVVENAVFNLCYNISQVYIPEGVTVIEDFAFNHCKLITTLKIPDSVTSIGKRAFQSCEKLVQVDLGKGVEKINEDAFKGCTGLLEIINRSDLDITAGSEDYGEIGLYAIVISKGESKMVNYDGYLFICSEEKNVLVSYIGNETELHLPTLPDGETYEIGNRLFKGRDDLTAVHIPNCVTSIGYKAFSECDGLTTMTLPDSVQIIGDGAFSGCLFTSFDMGDGVVSIGISAFSYCRKLQNIKMSSNLQIIGASAFNSCYEVDLEIPSSVREIGEQAFSGCFKISKAVIPDGVTIIEAKAFDNCKALVSIVIPTSVVEIKEGAFYACYKLNSISYKGTEEQWNEIILAYNNGIFNKVKTYYNYK